MTQVLDIKEQPRLPMYRQVEVTASGIHHRLLRSVITLSIVILAVAFLMNTLTESFIARSMREGIAQRTVQDRGFARFIALTSGNLSGAELQKRLADLPRGAWQVEALAAWLGMEAPQAQEFRNQCLRAEQASMWLDDLKIGHRRRLLPEYVTLADEEGRARAFAELADPHRLGQFVLAAREIPLSVPRNFLDFVGAYQSFTQTRQAALASLIQHREAFTRDAGGVSLGQWLETASDQPQRREEIVQVLAGHRVILSDTMLSNLLVLARAEAQRAALINSVNQTEVRVAWRAQFGAYSQDDTLRKLASDTVTARWLYVTQTRLLFSNAEQRAILEGTWQQKFGQPYSAAGVNKALFENADLFALLEDRARQEGRVMPPSPPQTMAAAQQWLRSEEVRALEGDLIANYGSEEGLGGRAFWLIVVSLMVCVAGITNAMLISVIERFREIATMKCLGALDGFIAKLFLLEAAFLGLTGGLIGVVLGLLIGTLRMAGSYGSWVSVFYPTSSLLGGAGISILCGLGLATLAAIYPSYAASRMPPMEAMRVE